MAFRWNITLIGSNSDLDVNDSTIGSYLKPYLTKVRGLENLQNNIIVEEYTTGTYGLFPDIVETGDMTKYINDFQFDNHNARLKFSIKLEECVFGSSVIDFFEWASIIKHPFKWIYTKDYPPFSWYYTGANGLDVGTGHEDKSRCHAVAYTGKHQTERLNSSGTKILVTTLDFESRTPDWS